MHGRMINRDPQLLPLVDFLIERGADLDSVSTYSESALSVSSNHGRFDVVNPFHRRSSWRSMPFTGYYARQAIARSPTGTMVIFRYFLCLLPMM